jgi:chromosome partitioning protein
MMKTLVMAQHHPDVGRSTLATMLVRHLARHGRRVLAIDLDHPGAMARALRRSGCVAEVPLAEDTLIGDALPRLPDARRGTVVLIDGAGRWRGLDRRPRQRDNLVGNLQDLLAIARRRFDACVIDTPARPDARLLAGLACADFVLVPTPLDQAALGSVGYLFWHAWCGIHAVQGRLNPRLHLLGLLPTMVPPGACHEGRAAPLAGLASLAAAHRLALIHVCPPTGLAGELGYMPRHPQIGQALATGQMPWEVTATAARAAWNEVRPAIEGLAARLTAVEVRP